MDGLDAMRRDQTTVVDVLQTMLYHAALPSPWHLGQYLDIAYRASPLKCLLLLVHLCPVKLYIAMDDE